MKKRILVLSGAIGIGFISLTSNSSGPSPTGNRTGTTPSTAGCSGTGCHGGISTNVVSLVGLIDGNNPVTEYTPGKSYTLSIAASNHAGGHPKYGFQVACVKAGTNIPAGTFSAGTAVGVGTATAGTMPVLESKTALSGGAAAGLNTYGTLATWTAPAASTGPVKFYLVLNSVDGNGAANAADNWDTASSSIYSVGTTSVSAATMPTLQLSPNPAANDLHVQGLTGAAVLHVVDASGRVVAEQLVAPGQSEATITVTSLPSGLYGIRIQTADDVQGRLFFKQ